MIAAVRQHRRPTLWEDFDRFFERPLGLLPRRRLLLPELRKAEAWIPDMDVFERNGNTVVRIDLPGMKREDVSIEVADNALTIHGERKREHEEERDGVYRSERSYGSFYRTIPLPEGAITEQAKATFRDGVLEIRMPAPPASKGRRLEITEGTKS